MAPSTDKLPVPFPDEEKKQVGLTRSLKKSVEPSPEPLPATNILPKSPGRNLIENRTVEQIEPFAQRTVAGYEILELLGRGGMAVVYRARQIKLNRIVALKMIRTGQLDDPELHSRFTLEAEAVAGLQHPNIIQIHDYGYFDEIAFRERCPFVALEYLPGGDLSSYRKKWNPSANEAAAFVETLARAIHYAHEHGIVHRDLKPTNILITADGQPKISDFGLVKRLDADNDQLTRTGIIMGTPEYMAPEQAAGKTDIGIGVDIYSLGVILYELLTGSVPLIAPTVMTTVEKVINDDPPSLRKQHVTISRDLETVCLKCLRKESQQRYTSAQELAEDLRRVQEGEPILARRISSGERILKWARRRPALTALLFLVCLLVVVGFPGVTVLWIRASIANEAVRKETKKAEEAMNKEAEKRLLAEIRKIEIEKLRKKELLSKARLALDSGQSLCEKREVKRGLDLLNQSLNMYRELGHTDMVSVVRQTHADWQSQVFTPLKELLLPTNKKAYCCLYLQDGKTVLIGMENGIHCYDLQANKVTKVIPPGATWDLWSSPVRMALDPTGNIVAINRFNGSVQLWDLKQGKTLKRFCPGNGTANNGLVFNAKGDRLFVAQKKNILAIDWKSGKETILKKHFVPISCLGYDPVNNRLAYGSDERVTIILDAENGEEIARTIPLSDRQTNLTFSPDGYQLVAGCLDGTAHMFNPKNGIKNGPMLSHNSLIDHIKFYPNSHRFLTASRDKVVRLWHTHSGNQIGEPLQTHNSSLFIDVHPNGQSCIIGGHESVQVWGLPNAKLQGPLVRNNHRIHSAYFINEGEGCVVGSYSGAGIILKLSMKTMRCCTYTAGTNVKIFSVTLAPNKKLIGGTDWFGRLFFVDLEKHAGDCQTSSYVMKLNKGNPRLLRFGPDSIKLWMTIADDRFANYARMITCLDIQNKTFIPRPLFAEDLVTDFRLNPDGTRLVYTCINGNVCMVDTKTLKPLGKKANLKERLNSICFSQNPDQVFVGNHEGSIRMIDIPTGKVLLSGQYHQGPVWDLDMNPNGTRLASAGADGKVRLWDTKTLVPIGAPMQHSDSVEAVSFRKDGRSIISGGRGQVALMWNVEEK